MLFLIEKPQYSCFISISINKNNASIAKNLLISITNEVKSLLNASVKLRIFPTIDASRKCLFILVAACPLFWEVIKIYVGKNNGIL